MQIDVSGHILDWSYVDIDPIVSNNNAGFDQVYYFVRNNFHKLFWLENFHKQFSFVLAQRNLRREHTKRKRGRVVRNKEVWC
jgi:hypothetical protein